MKVRCHLTSKLKTMVHEALKELQDQTGGCIAFSEVDDRPSSSFIAYREVPSLGPGVCADSPLGRQSDVNVINVATTCQVFGTLIHETMHSLGFAHTQQRPDVEQYLTINWRNIDPSAAPNFKPWKYALKNQGPFDYGSILMYPRTAFAINPYKDTLTPKRDPDHNGDLMGQRERLSDEDVNILKKIYCSQSGSAGGSEGENFKSLYNQVFEKSTET
uniref:Metalloendopeptidase n=1 Tax=Romanomermis culicivorax TaxID=13658 RepID=A0A915HGG1_ROMCU